MKGRISVRGGFSDRNGIKVVNEEIQYKEFDERTRIRLKNYIFKLYNRVYSFECVISNNELLRLKREFFEKIYDDVFVEPLCGQGGLFEQRVWKRINEVIDQGEYDDILTIVEYLIRLWDDVLKDNTDTYYMKWCNKYSNGSLFEYINDFFEIENMGCRFIGGLIEPITDEREINTINEALASDNNSVEEHFKKALVFLADRSNPDYPNSIKESISAVEAYSAQILGDNSKENSLGRMLKRFEKRGVRIHPSLKVAFEKLYGYASDMKGVRHAGNTDSPEVTFEEAKFMLVLCCAFVNYLKGINKD